MKLELICAWRNLVTLFRFLVLYGGGVAVLFYLLPAGVVYLERLYDALSAGQKIVALTVFLSLIAFRQFYNWRQSTGE